MNRLISLGVGTVGAEDFFRTFQDISELAKNLGGNHDYVNVTSQFIGEEIDEENTPEKLYCDEFTLTKVRRAIMRRGLSSQTAEDIINDLQNEGILFRERHPREYKIAGATSTTEKRTS